MSTLFDKLGKLIKVSGQKEEDIYAGCMAAAKEGDPEAQCLVGDMYYNGEGNLRQSYGDAAEWYRKAAEQGHAVAQYSLGSMYRVGLGMMQSDDEALKWLKLAADQGDVPAQVLLLETGKKNRTASLEFAKAVELTEKAAAGGDALAEAALGFFRETGCGMPVDREGAAEHYRSAAEKLGAGELKQYCDDKAG